MNSYDYVNEALTYMTEYPDYIDFVKNFNEESGFLYTEDKRVTEIFNGINNNNHSGASFALTLRVCQSIYRGLLTLDQYKEKCEGLK